jgi:hypothetical protein
MGVIPDSHRPIIYPQGTQLYGAHGQPLGPLPPQAASPHSDYAQPSQTSSYSSFTDDRTSESPNRPQQDLHPSILLPPVPGQPGYPRAGHSTSSHSNLQPPQVSSSGLPSRIPPSRNSPGEGRSDPMSLSSIMERRPDTEIDRSMLGRLDRKGQ